MFNADAADAVCRDTNLLVWGVDLVEEHLMCSAGIPARPPAARKPLVQMAEYSINANKTGIIKHFDYLKQWQSHPDVLYCRPLVQVSIYLGTHELPRHVTASCMVQNL